MNETNTRIADTPMPDRMVRLPTDHRGYPIPWIVMRDRAGKPHFTVNDHARVSECIRYRLCGICGGALGRITDKNPHKGAWFIAGPASFLLENGAFLDPPMHFECGEYAARVCPYIAMPSYGKRIDDKTVKPGMMHDHTTVIAHPAATEKRPPMFFMGQAADYTVDKSTPGLPLFKIKRADWRIVTVWRGGEAVEVNEALMDDIRAYVEKTVAEVNEKHASMRGA